MLITVEITHLIAYIRNQLSNINNKKNSDDVSFFQSRSQRPEVRLEQIGELADFTVEAISEMLYENAQITNLGVF